MNFLCNWGGDGPIGVVGRIKDFPGGVDGIHDDSDVFNVFVVDGMI